MTKLSVIIPCYNSEKTLREAVASVFQQEPGIPFDVTIVDDGSTDATYAVMRRLAASDPRINLVRHASNQGGGAARNTAVANSDGDLIFCLDSDDMLGPQFLRNMVRFWQQKKCDGLGMSTSVKFKKSNINDVAYVHDFEGPGKPVRFESLLDGSLGSLSVTFMITRRAFLRVGGYPTDHGFDTQGIAFRFLCEGLTAYTCPDTTYYQRVEYHESYYLREQSAGRLNWNWLNIFDEHLYIFRDEVKAEILTADLFPAPGKPPPTDLLSRVLRRPDIYAPNYRTLVRLGKAGVARRLARRGHMFDHYWIGRYHASRAQYRRALHHFIRALELGFNYRIIYYRILAASLRLSESGASVPESLEELARYSQPLPLERWPLSKRIIRTSMRSKLLGGPTRTLTSAVDQLKRTWQDTHPANAVAAPAGPDDRRSRR